MNESAWEPNSFSNHERSFLNEDRTHTRFEISHLDKDANESIYLVIHSLYFRRIGLEIFRTAETYHRNRVDISKIQRLYIFPEDIDKLYRIGIHCNFMYRESRFRGWDSFHHSSASIRWGGGGAGRVDSRRRRDKTEGERGWRRWKEKEKET